MALDLAIQAPSSPSLDAIALILLHFEGQFRLLERTLRDFQLLERQLQLESTQRRGSRIVASVYEAVEASCDAKPSFYPLNQLGSRLAVTLEDFLRQLVTNYELLKESEALQTFFYGTFLSSHDSYRDAIENAFCTGATKTMDERVAAGCRTEYAQSIDEEQLLMWKFTSQGSGLVFSAEFASGEAKEVDLDPYSVDNMKEEGREDRVVVCYRTRCHFAADGEPSCVYGHYVASKRGVVTLQWENLDMDSIVSRPLQFQVTRLPLAAAKTVLNTASEVSGEHSAEWLHDFVLASKITSLKDLPEWEMYDIEANTYGQDADEDNIGTKDVVRHSRVDSALLEERTLQLEAQVNRLEEKLAITKTKLNSAQDRVEIADEINKANLETIAQLERANAGGVSKWTKKAKDTAPIPQAAASDPVPLTPELERAQKLCASFQEQCLWRSVENTELETQLAASQVEATSWRQKHVEQAAQIEKLEKHNQTLRAHKKMLVDEVKRLQPYSQVNLTALVQEAQEARMMQRSLQAKLDCHDQLQHKSVEMRAETSASDFVLVEASDEEG